MRRVRKNLQPSQCANCGSTTTEWFACIECGKKYCIDHCTTLRPSADGSLYGYCPQGHQVPIAFLGYVRD